MRLIKKDNILRLLKGKTYLFLDEIQEVSSWEKVVNSLMTDYDVDIYVTGSNSRMMSSEISTYLTGRYISFRIFPLSFSAASISKYLKSENRAIDNETVYSYLNKLESAYILHRCSRFDVQGKEILKTQEKFYLADPALRYSVLRYSADSAEIDFIAVKQEHKLYIQVAQEIGSPETEKREYGRRLDIRDNYPKYVLRTDVFAGGNYEEIKTMHVADFLLSDKY